MIISASRRTDIPSYFSEWFWERIKAGYVLVRNPFNSHQISKISLAPEDVDCFVFWTKNPSPMIDQLDKLKEYNYYFQLTLTSYGQDIEANVPSKKNIIIPAFLKLADKIGKEKVIWRYDPILLNQKYNLEYHLTYFEKLAKLLHKSTEKCTISFIDFYKNASYNMRDLDMQEISEDNKFYIAKGLAEIAAGYGLKMDACAEDIDLSDFNILPAHCVDSDLIQRITGSEIIIKKDPNQRAKCGCAASVDIGTYNTCPNACKYCYASYNMKTLKKNLNLYDVTAPLLCGQVNQGDTIVSRGRGC